MKWFSVICALLAFAVPSKALDREAFSFTRYDLDATIDAGQQRLGMRGKITLRNDSDLPQRNIVLQISSSLHWVSIQLGGKPAEFITQTYTSDIDHTGALSEAIVTLPKPIAPKEATELSVGYEGTIPQDATRLTRIGVPAEVAKHSDWDQISSGFTAVRGIGYVVWYPIATEVANMSDAASITEAVGRWKERQHDAEMSICMPDGALMNDTGQGAAGAKSSGDTAGNTSHCIQHVFFGGETVPVFVIADFNEVQNGNFIIRYLADHKSAADDYVLALNQVGPSISVWLGAHSEPNGMKSQVIDLPDSNAAPFQSGNTLMMPIAEDETTMLLMAVQQVAQLDFPSSRAWINQGLARYMQLRYIEQEKERAGVLHYLNTHRDPLVEMERQSPEKGSPAAAARSLINSSDEFYLETKAMNVWWMLRELVGETALTAALHNYKASDDKDALYMQKLLEQQSRRDLTWFFDDWVYRDRGLPDFRIDSVHARPVVSGGYMVAVTVENLGGAAAEVPVKLEMTEGDATEKLIVPGKSKASVRILAAATPIKAIVNDGTVPESDTSNNEFSISAEALNQ
ncbi:MAG TPA: hypothetical protein VN682_20785 [Terriglobales bacterium]|nr:hypothetical protein [Terriglobales bacterium]